MVVFIAKTILWLLLALTVIVGGAVIVMSFVKTGKEIKYGKPPVKYGPSPERKKQIEKENRIDNLLDAHRKEIAILDEETVYLDTELLNELCSIDPFLWKRAFDEKFGTNISGMRDYETEMMGAFEDDY